MKISIEFNNFEDTKRFVDYIAEYDKNPVLSTETTEPPTPAVEKKTRRRRSKKEIEAAKEEEPASRRGRRAPKEDEADGSGGAEISDAEISKAASEAAGSLTVQVVLDELHKFEVDKVSELDQSARVHFMDILRDLLNPAKDANSAFE